MSIPTQPTSAPARSHFTTTSIEQDFGSDVDESVELQNEREDAVHFCLLAEFDIDAGATLAYQYPYPTGTDEQ